VINPKEIDKAFKDFDAAIPRTSKVSSPDPGQACAAYKQIRAPLSAIVKALEATGMLLPVAGKAASVIKILSGLLDKLCR
jgi:hypothetical protein